MHIFLISQDVVGRRMAGPAIRYFHMAKVLSQRFRVTLAFTFPDPANTQADLAYLQTHLPQTD